MKKLSNSDLRTLFIRKSTIQVFLETSTLQLQNIGDSWERLRDQINNIRKEIKSIVADPQFDVSVPFIVVPRSVTRGISITGAFTNTVTTAKFLLSYIDQILSLNLTPKTDDLKQNKMKTGRVFIGHGHNEIVRHKVKDFLRDRCCLDTIILKELPSSGLTTIEKLEKYSRVADYAILIFTGDDIVIEQKSEDSKKQRARQNVVQELGWFQGTLGRNRTCLLVQKGVELFSNIGGVVSLRFNDTDVESVFEELRKELEDAQLL